MKTLRFKTIEEFQNKIMGCETTELADVLLEAIQRGMKNNTKKVTVCDVEIEEVMKVEKSFEKKYSRTYPFINLILA
jgi:hypothetical protein